MIDFINAFFSVLRSYTGTLFEMQIVQGVTVGSLFLYAILISIVASVVWRVR